MIRDSVYLRGVKLHILLLRKDTTFMYKNTAKDGSNGYQFTPNFGVDTSKYGETISGKNCLFGIQTLDLYFFRSRIYTNKTSFLFEISDNQVQDINSSYAYEVKVQIVCLGGGKISTVNLTEGDGINVYGIVGGTIGGSVLMILLGCFIYKYCFGAMESEVTGLPSEDRLNILNQADEAEGWIRKNFS